MMLDDLAARLSNVQHTATGVKALCPAHADRSPSLSVKVGERGLLVHCWAGCTLAEIVAALGLRTRDLFFDAGQPKHLRRALPPKPRFDRNRLAFELRLHGDLLHLRSQGVLAAATGLDTTEWSDADFDRAVRAVAIAYDDADRAELLDQVAFNFRRKLLNREVRDAA